jgi:tetratricopeptide (TPR) repeat protein
MGFFDEAKTAFREAEDIQKQELVSQWGFMYCSLLLDLNEYNNVQRRARNSLDLLEPGNQAQLLEIALDHLSLAHAYLGNGDFNKCNSHLVETIGKLQQSGRQDHLPRGLLASAALHRCQGKYSRAQADLAEAQRIAERGEMGLHLCDCHLEWARLCLSQGERDKAREHWATAKAMVERMGYHRRDGEVDEIGRELG